MATKLERLHVKGRAKRTGKLIPSSDGRRRKEETPVQRVMADLTKLFSDATGQSSQRKGQAKQAAAKREAATRKRNAQRRGTAANKAARTRRQSS